MKPSFFITLFDWKNIDESDHNLTTFSQWLPHKSMWSSALAHILNIIHFTFCVLSDDANWWLFTGLLEGCNLSIVSPERIALLMLLLDESIIGNISGKEWLVLCGIGALRDLSKSCSELVLTIFAWDISAVARHLRSLVA